MSATVAQWTHYAQEGEQRYGVPADVLLGLIDVESAGVPGRTSSAGAGGLTQFMPDIARAYGVNVQPGHERGQVLGAAHLLADLGFADDPVKALREYNGGTNAASIPETLTYARTVLERAKKYAHASSSPTPAPTRAPATSAPAAAGGGSDPSWALRALLTAGLVGLGLALVVGGGGRMVGVDVGRGIRKGAAAAAMAVPK